jgi:hypothetical protein
MSDGQQAPGVGVSWYFGGRSISAAHPIVAGDCLNSLSPPCRLCNSFSDVSVPMEGFVLEDVRHLARAWLPGSEYKHFPPALTNLAKSAVDGQWPA